MRSKTLLAGLLTVLALAACAEPGGLGERDDPDSPLLQVRSEGGFVPIEWALGQGPSYTLLADGRLIHSGPIIMIFPAPLLPNYQVVRADQQQMDRVLTLVEEIGLPQVDHEIDDSAADMVADASTEVVTFWDEGGDSHTYGVYALGLDVDGEQPAAHGAMQELITALGEISAQGTSETYAGDRVRVIANVVPPEQDVSDVRDWPLGDTDLSEWQTLPSGWGCQVFGPEILDQFADATEQTLWTYPEEDERPFKLLVRPLHPGEPDCPSS